MNIDDIVSYYSNLLIIQYNDKPKAKALIELCVRELLANGILFDIREAFNVDTAIGVQLDVVGKYVDLDRFYAGQTLLGFFSLTDYNEFPLDPDHIGFTDYTEGFDKVGRTLTYNDYLSNNQALNDDDFRTLIKLRIIQNNVNHSHKVINDAIYTFFGDTLFPDSVGNMVMWYFYEGVLPAILTAAFQKKLLPKPLAVRLGALIVHSRPLFGLASYEHGIPPGIEGCTNYTAGFDSKGEMLTYNKAMVGY